MKDELMYYIRAGYPCLSIKSPEDIRVQAMFREIAEELNQREGNDYDLYTFDHHDGLVNVLEPGGNGTTDPIEAITVASKMDGQSIVLFSNYHVYLEGGGSQMAVEVSRAIRNAKLHGNHLIFVGCRSVIPPEIQWEVTELDIPLPKRDELRSVVLQTAEDAGIDAPEGLALESIVGAVQGLTLTGASDALAYSLVKHGRFFAKDIAMEKAKQINRDGLMKVVSGEGSLDDIGGLEEIKRWVLVRSNIFDPKAKLRGATLSRGVLTIGVPGSGKSFFSRILGNVFGLPVLRVNMGSLMGSLVGQSEGNLRRVKDTAMAMAPCIVEIDEIDKGVGSAMNGPSTDSGTTDRVTQDLLTWMAEEHEGVFIVATANDPEKLRGSGGALTRKGRFDNIFFFDFPHAKERDAIIRIHINKRSRLNPACPLSPIGSADEVDVASLVDLSKGFTGAEIEAAVADTFTEAAATESDIETADFITQFLDVNPISESQKDGIDKIRKWAAAHCKPASAPDPDAHRPAVPAKGVGRRAIKLEEAVA